MRWPASSEPGRWALILVVLAMLGCKKDAPPDPEPEHIAKPVKRTAPIRRATLERCREEAVRVRGRGNPPGELPLIDMPPAATDDVDPATRRLKSLQAVDSLQRQLETAPSRPAIYFQLGQIYLWSLENPVEAGRHLCRAMLLARRARSPAVERYERAVFSAWMHPSLQERFELSLEPGERNLPWLEALALARKLRGVTWEQRAAALDGAVVAQRILRNARLMPRHRSRGELDDLVKTLTGWAKPDGPEFWIVVSFPRTLRGRVAALNDRRKEGFATGDLPSRVWGTVGPGPRWLLYARGLEALPELLGYAEHRLAGRRIGVSARQGARRLYFAGRLSDGGMRVDARAMKPEVTEITQALLPKATR